MVFLKHTNQIASLSCLNHPKGSLHFRYDLHLCPSPKAQRSPLAALPSHPVPPGPRLFFFPSGPSDFAGPGPAADGHLLTPDQ